MKLVMLALLAPVFVAGCNSTPYNTGPAEQAAKAPCNIGSGMDAIVSIQKGTAKCPGGGQAYATARNNPAGYSTVIMAKP